MKVKKRSWEVVMVLVVTAGLVAGLLTHPSNLHHQQEQISKGSQQTKGQETAEEEERDGKLFVILAKIPATQCSTSDNLTLGTCMASSVHCTNNGGTSKGSCASILSSCCLVYYDVDPSGGAVKLTINRSVQASLTTAWNIQVTQVPCHSMYRAPEGCLQYYTGTTDTVYSFNFLNTAASQSGTINTSSRDGDCTTDYVVIPGGMYTNTSTSTVALPAGRYCGLGFPPSVTTTSQPFVLYVKTDGSETLDTVNRGFCLKYRQTTSCA